MATRIQSEQAEAVQWLRKRLRPGQTVYTVLRHVSSSGMSRRIDLYAIKGNEPVYLSGMAGRAMGYRRHKDGGLVVSGCGMDMGFHLVYELGRVLFPNGFKVEGRGRNGDMSGHDNDGGYALDHRWI